MSVPFPVMDPAFLDKGIKVLRSPELSEGRRFLFVGHLRREKGIDVLLKAWQRVQIECPDCSLTVAGNLPNGEILDLTGLNPSKVRVIGRYLSDEEYVQLINDTDCVILPYKRGTNSGIPGTVLVLERGLIVSDIPMFRNNTLIPLASFFASEDVDALVQQILAYASKTVETRSRIRAGTNAHLIEYRQQFREKLCAVIRQLEPQN